MLAAYPASWTVRRARDQYLADNGFTLQGYEDAWTEASFLGIPLKVPNTPHHAWAIKRHDLHHVVTGFGTDLAGEGEVSAWELRRGLRDLDTYVSALVVMGTLWGTVLAPRRALAAWRGSGRARSSLFATADAAAYERLLDLTVGELRETLGVPVEGLATKRALHSRAPRTARVSI